MKAREGTLSSHYVQKEAQGAFLSFLSTLRAALTQVKDAGVKLPCQGPSMHWQISDFSTGLTGTPVEIVYLHGRICV